MRLRRTIVTALLTVLVPVAACGGRATTAPGSDALLPGRLPGLLAHEAGHPGLRAADLVTTPADAFRP